MCFWIIKWLRRTKENENDDSLNDIEQARNRPVTNNLIAEQPRSYLHHPDPQREPEPQVTPIRQPEIKPPPSPQPEIPTQAQTEIGPAPVIIMVDPFYASPMTTMQPAHMILISLPKFRLQIYMYPQALNNQSPSLN